MIACVGIALIAISKDQGVRRVGEITYLCGLLAFLLTNPLAMKLLHF